MKPILELSLTTRRHMLLVKLISKHIFTNYKKEHFFNSLPTYTFIYVAVVIVLLFKLYFLISFCSVHSIIRVYDIITIFIPIINPFKWGKIIIIVYNLSLRLYSSQIDGKRMVLQNVFGIGMPFVFRFKK
jgi:hypothetical protein